MSTSNKKSKMGQRAPKNPTPSPQRMVDSGPVEAALLPDSTLRPLRKQGLGALENADRDYIATSIRNDFADSLDIDSGLKEGHENENRWDYLLGHAPSNTVVGLEPHSAKEDQISTVIRKRTSALKQLRGHLRSGAFVAKWYWVASGRVDFLTFEKASFRLNQAGIEFVGRQLQARHLPRIPTQQSASKNG